MERAVEVKALLYQSLSAALSSLLQVAQHTARDMWSLAESRSMALQELLVPSDLGLSQLPLQSRVPPPISRSFLALVAPVELSVLVIKALELVAWYLVQRALPEEASLIQAGQDMALSLTRLPS